MIDNIPAKLLSNNENLTIMEFTKKEYNAPEIIKIVLDCQISLAMESDPPIGPEESQNFIIEKTNTNPYNYS